MRTQTDDKTLTHGIFRFLRIAYPRAVFHDTNRTRPTCWRCHVYQEKRHRAEIISRYRGDPLIRSDIQMLVLLASNHKKI
jgi:hypothetical protein